jgi:hypothetical protein
MLGCPPARSGRCSTARSMPSGPPGATASSTTAVAGLTHSALIVNFRTDAASGPIREIGAEDAVWKTVKDDTALVADLPAREADQDRREGSQLRVLRHFSARRGRGAPPAVRRNPVADRPTACTARAGMRSSGSQCGRGEGRIRGEVRFRASKSGTLQQWSASLAGLNRSLRAATAICRCQSR